MRWVAFVLMVLVPPPRSTREGGLEPRNSLDGESDLLTTRFNGCTLMHVLEAKVWAGPTGPHDNVGGCRVSACTPC
eukprot:COSAG02_NODE_1502_length_12258_cov_12.486142_10_plen_76_part_00